MSYVVIYYSFTGNNRLLASELQRRLGCECIEVREARHRSRMTILLDVLLDRKPRLEAAPASLAHYDKAVLVAPVWAGRIATPLAAFVARHRAELPDYGFLSLCSGVPGQPARIADELERLAGRPPLAVDQLDVNELLPAEHKNKVRYTSAYRARAQDMPAYGDAIDRFLHDLAGSGAARPEGWRAPAPSSSRPPGAPA